MGITIQCAVRRAEGAGGEQADTQWLFVCRLNVYISLRVSPAASWAHGSPRAETGASGTPALPWGRSPEKERAPGLRSLQTTCLPTGPVPWAGRPGAGSASRLAGGEQAERPHLWSLRPALSPLPPACPQSVCPRLGDGQQGNTAHRRQEGAAGSGRGEPQPAQPGPCRASQACAPRPRPRPHPTDGDEGAQGWGWYLIRNPGLLPAQWTVSPEAWEVGCPLPLHPNLAHLTHSSGPVWPEETGQHRNAVAANGTSSLQGTVLDPPEASEETKLRPRKGRQASQGRPSVRHPSQACPSPRGHPAPGARRPGQPSPPPSAAPTLSGPGPRLPCPPRTAMAPARGGRGGRDLMRSAPGAGAAGPIPATLRSPPHP